MSEKAQASTQTRRRRRRRRKADEEHGVRHPTGLANLQQRVGNRAVQRLLAQREAKTVAPEETVKPEELEETEKPEPVRFLSGEHWVEAFPASDSISDLMPGFRLRVQKFTAALEEAGGEVEILATRQPEERSYLMHWAWKIAREDYDPRKVPAMNGVNINWWHGDAQTSKEAARKMIEGYGIDEREAELPTPEECPHAKGNAVDMAISWKGELTIKDATGKEVVIQVPRDETNRQLIAVARTYGVVHFADVHKDTVHWSLDGK